MWCYRNKSFIVKGVTWRYGFYSTIEQEPSGISGRKAYIVGRYYRSYREIAKAKEYSFNTGYLDGSMYARV